MALVSVALAQARTLLNDDIASIWSDAALIPKLQIAHQELQSALWEVGSPVVREESSIISVAASAVPTDLGVSQPTDLLAPTKLYEYDVAAGPVYSNPVEMTEVFYLPKNITLTAKLIYWCWREEKIIFLGATATRGVQVQYRKLIAVPTLSSEQIGITFGEIYLAPRVAALAAGSTGNADVLKIATGMAEVGFNKVLATHRGQQTTLGKP